MDIVLEKDTAGRWYIKTVQYGPDALTPVEAEKLARELLEAAKTVRQRSAPTRHLGDY